MLLDSFLVQFRTGLVLNKKNLCDLCGYVVHKALYLQL